MALNPAVLGVLLAAAATSGNPAALVVSTPQWAAIAAAWCLHMQTAATVGPTALVCPSSGGPVTGIATVGGMDGNVLGVLLAAAASGPNPAAIAPSTPTWIAIAKAFVSHVTANATGSPNGTLLAPAGSPTAGGPLTGSGLIAGMDPSVLGPAFAVAAVPQKPSSVLANWTAIASAMIVHITTQGALGPGTLAAASGGGPILIGTGVIQ